MRKRRRKTRKLRRKRRISQLPKQNLQVKSKTLDEKTPEDLREYIREADSVKVLTQMGGWAVIERDVLRYREGIMQKLAYTNPRRLEYEEARILVIAVDKLLALVNDYETNRENAIDMLNKLENPDTMITLDVDNG